tara:strand:+ start:10222 stop:11859 length:1638 start_codon:yes stop_codon:yes gene_type:complete
MPLRLKKTSSSSLIWLLEVTFGGRLYRFSTEPVNISKDNGSVISFEGGLDDPGFSETLSRFDHSIDQQVISLDLDFNTDVAGQIQKGHYLSGSKAELSCVLVSDGSIEQTYEGRLVVLSGFITSPQYAFPDQPQGVVSLSVEASAAQDDGLIILPSDSIQQGITTAALTPHDGKPYPLVFGTPGTYKDSDGTSTHVPGSPAYILNYDWDTGSATRLLIAGHHVNAETVFITNGDGQELSFNVTNGLDELSRQIAYCSPSYSASFDNKKEPYWVNWRPTSGSFYGGGIKNPWNTSQELDGAGDVIRYILQFSTLEVDHGEFAAVSDYLNQFKVSGYINNFETSPWDWVSALAEVLPMSIKNGPNGLYPIVHDVRAPSSHGFSVSASLEFQQISPVQVEAGLSEIYNSISIGYAFDAKENSPCRYGVTGIKQSGNPSSFSTSATTTSIARYGQRWKRVESAYVYERSTAQRIIRYISDTEALPARSVQYRAAPQFAFLTLGDIVSLTDSNLGFTDQACFVSAKAWDVDSWVFTLTIDRIPDRDSYTS